MEKWGDNERNWYNSRVVQFNLFRGLKDRYMSILPNVNSEAKKIIRYQKVTSTGLFVNIFTKWNVSDKHKLYMDLATWKNMIMFSYDPKEREKQKEDFCLNIENNISDIDFGIDIDAEKDKDGNKKDWRITHKAALKVRDWLKAKKIPYAVWNSSDNGFQFFIPGSHFKNFKSMTKKVQHYGQMAKKIRGVKVDQSVYDLRRFFKLPYSLCNGIVVLPLTDIQLDNFTPEMVKPEWVRAKIDLYNRGWLIREYGGK